MLNNPQAVITAINGIISIIDLVAQTGLVRGKSLESLLAARVKLTEVIIENQSEINRLGEQFQAEEAERNQ